MKRVSSIVVGLTFLLVTMGVSFAEQCAKSKVTAPCEKKCAQQKCRGMMTHATMPRSVIETKDGGIVVVTGSKLLKYDKDFNLLREVALPADMACMQKMKKKKMGECPWHKKMMEEGSVMEEGSSTKQGSAHKSE